MQLPRSHAPEWLDQMAAGGDSGSLNILCGNLRDIARYNRWLGAHTLMRRLVREVVGPADSRPYTGLDVGAGSGDFVAYVSRAERAHWVGIEVSRDVLRCVEAPSRGSAYVAGSGLWLPFADGGADVVTCAQTLHHLEPAQAARLMRECARVARRGVVIVDLVRSYPTLIGAWLLTRLTSRNPMTRADGLQSARRAYTLAEARDLARQAGWLNAHIRSHGPVRYSITWRNGTGGFSTAGASGVPPQ